MMLVDFHSLFERHSQDVFRFTLYLSGDPSLAEEGEEPRHGTAEG